MYVVLSAINDDSPEIFSLFEPHAIKKVADIAQISGIVKRFLFI